MTFEDLIQLPIFERKQSIRKKVFKEFWMTTKENFKIVKRIESENAKKELDKKKKEGIISQALAKAKKTKALKKGKAKKNVKKNPTLNCKLCHLKPFPAYCQIS